MNDKFDPLAAFRGRDFGPVILEPCCVILTPTPAEILAETFRLINDITIRWLKQDLERTANDGSSAFR